MIVKGKIIMSWFRRKKWNKQVKAIWFELYFDLNLSDKPIPPPGVTMINDKETRESRQKREAWNLYMNDRKVNK